MESLKYAKWICVYSLFTIVLIKLQHLLVSQIHGIYFLARLKTSGENRFSAPTVIFHFKYCLNFRRIFNGNPAGDSEVTLSTEKEEGWRNGAWLKQAFVHKLTSAIRKMYTVPPCVFKIWNSFLTASRCCLPLGFALQSESGPALLWSSGAGEVHCVLCGWRPSLYHMAADQRRGLAFPGIWWTVCMFGWRANSWRWLSQGGLRDTFWFCFPVYMVCTDGGKRRGWGTGWCIKRGGAR